jgi:hypothetical protein
MGDSKELFRWWLGERLLDWLWKVVSGASVFGMIATLLGRYLATEAWAHDLWVAFLCFAFVAVTSTVIGVLGFIGHAGYQKGQNAGRKRVIDGTFPAPVAESVNEARTRADIAASYGQRFPGRVFLGRSLMEITQPYREHTSAQADRLASVYLNKWIVVEGVIRNVYSGQDDTRVSIDGGGIRLGQPPDVSLTFSATLTNHVIHLGKGEKITAAGRIEHIGQFEVHLTDCELYQSQKG